MKELKLNYPLEDTYLVAVSGGPDSMALLSMLTKLNYKLVICHVNYHKRKESNFEECKVKEYAKVHNLPCEVLDTTNMNIEGNFQAWARKIRYEFFKEQYDKYAAKGLFIAHQKDDLLETYIMQKRRHNIVSYFGIKDETEILGMQILRPLLDFRKQELEDYCIEHHVFYSIDSSNLSNDYTRNKIRHEIVSKMNEEQIDKMVEEINSRNQELEIHFKKSKELLENNDYSRLSWEKLDTLEQNIFLYLYIKEALPTMSINMSYTKILEMKKILHSSKANARMILSKPYYFVKAYDKFYIEEKLENYDYEYQIDKPQVVDNKYFRIDLTKDVAPLKIYPSSYPLTIRNVRKDDVVMIGNLQKRVNRILIDEKIDAQMRKYYPIILDNEGKVVYIPLKRSNQQKVLANKLGFVLKYSLH